MFKDPMAGVIQRGLIEVHEDNVVSQDDPVGALYAAGAGAHVQFGGGAIRQLIFFFAGCFAAPYLPGTSSI